MEKLLRFGITYLKRFAAGSLFSGDAASLARLAPAGEDIFVLMSMCCWSDGENAVVEVDGGI